MSTLGILTQVTGSGAGLCRSVGLEFRGHLYRTSGREAAVAGIMECAAELLGLCGFQPGGLVVVAFMPSSFSPGRCCPHFVAWILAFSSPEAACGGIRVGFFVTSLVRVGH
jgi:hypothetical protein